MPNAPTRNRTETKPIRHSNLPTENPRPGRLGARRIVARLGRLEGQRQAERDRGDHVDPEDLDRRDRQGQPECKGRENSQSLAAIGRQGPADDLHQVVVNRPALAHRRDDRREIVVGEHHLGRFLGGLRTLAPHGDADVGALQRRRIVYPVAGHRDRQPVRLQCLYEAQLVFGGGACKHVSLEHRGFQRFVAEPLDVLTGPA